jgi:drug/metabolite transporter (DMT)-like permease
MESVIKSMAAPLIGLTMTELHNEHPRWKGFLAAGAVILCWTGFNIVSRMGGKSVLTPFDITALRFLVSGVFMLPVYILVNNQLPLRRLIPVAAVGGMLYALLAYSGFVFAPAAHAGIIVNGGVPLATAGIAWLWLKDRPKGKSLLALAVAASGVMVIGIQSFSAPHEDNPMEWLGDIFFAAAACLWATYGILVRVWRVRPIDAVSGIAVGSAGIYLPVYLLFLPKAILHAPMGDILLQGFYQGIIAALIAAFSYAYATLSLGSGIASLLLAIVPATSAVLAVPLLGEPVTSATVAGVVLVTLGATMGAMVKRKAPTPKSQPH